MNLDPSLRPPTVAPQPLEVDASPARARPALFGVAERIAWQLCRDALRARGACNWLGWSMEPLGGRFEPVIRTFGADLYSGTTGIGLFLARVAALSGDKVIRRAAFGAVACLERATPAPPSASVGFFSGRVGQAWALDHMGEWLGAERLRERALQLLSELDGQLISPHELDVISGAAGAIPALLALRQRHTDSAVRSALLERARSLGRQLIAHAVPDAEGRLRWDTMKLAGQPPLTGQSHGASGIATALVELWAVESDGERREAWLSAAKDALDYERRLFVPALRNWPDLRKPSPNEPVPTPPPCNAVWCHGAPGIGLGRARCWELLRRERSEAVDLRHDLEAALLTTLETLDAPERFGGSFCQCHGFAGNAELPMHAAELLERPALLEAVHRVAERGREQHDRAGRPWPCGVARAGQTPGLMLGVAGIGWFYLRVCDPNGTPAVVLVRGHDAARRAAS